MHLHTSRYIYFPRWLHLGLMIGLSFFLSLVMFGLFVTHPGASAVFSLPPSPSEPLTPGSISGQVLNKNGTPLPGIRINLYRLYRSSRNPELERNTITTSDGTYHLTTLPPGVYAVEFFDPAGRYAFQFYGETTTMGSSTSLSIAGNEVTDINARLVSAGTIRGTVTSTADVKLPAHITLPAGTLSLYRQLNNEAWEYYPFLYSQVTETITIRGLASGLYRLCVNSRPYNYRECFDNIPAYTIDPDGNPVPGSGVANATDIAVTAGVTTTGVSIELGDIVYEPEISGLVQNQNNEPLSQILVRASQSHSANRYTTETNQLGLYRLQLRNPGTYTLEFLDPTRTYVSTVYQAEDNVVPTPVEVQYLSLRRGIDVTLTKAAHITGTVLVYGQDIPSSESSVYILNSVTDRAVLHATVDRATGRYDAGGLEAGTYKVMAVGELGRDTYSGYYGGSTIEEAQLITITTGEVRRNINVHVGVDEFEGTISGIVTADNLPAAQIHVDLYRASLDNEAYVPIYYMATDNRGFYQIQGLRSGKYKVRFSDPNDFYATTYYANEFTLDAAQPITLQSTITIMDANVVLPHGATIAGRIIQPNGIPVSHADVVPFVKTTQKWQELSDEATQSDEQGYYKLGGLPAGRYILRFNDPERSTFEYYGDTTAFEAATPITVTSGQTVTGIDLMLGPNAQLYLPMIHK